MDQENAEQGTIKVFLADDNLIVREGVRALIERHDDLRVVGMAADYDEVVSGAAATGPQVLVTDIRMPPAFEREGIDAAKEVRKRHPGTGVVVLSQYEDPEYAVSLLAEGSAGYGYLLKDHVAAGNQLADAERHRIERNLHDGAQQQLVALTIQLSLLEDDAGDADSVLQMTNELRSGLHAALNDLRALARGIYPPLLADQGLAPALQAQASKAPLPVFIEADGIGRYPRDAEAAAYFCILEALQNVAKYSQASRATVAVSCPDSHLEFSVTDDGAGLEPANITQGTGLQGMADRLAAVGGALRILSRPGHGTTVSGTLPVAPLTERGR